MDVENNEPEISPHTNKVVTTVKDAPIFWCETCHLKLISPTTALQHLSGRPHKAKVNAKKRSIQIDPSKRKRILDSSNVKSVGPVVHDPIAKKSKEGPAKVIASESSFKCIDCNIMFGSAINAKWHFEGKRHASMLAGKLASNHSVTQRAGCDVTAELGDKQSPTQRGAKTQVQTGGSGAVTGISASTQSIQQGIRGEVIIAGQHKNVSSGSNVNTSKFPSTEIKAVIPGGKGLLKDYFVNATTTRDINIKSFDSKQPDSLVEPPVNNLYICPPNNIQPTEVSNDFSVMQNNNFYSNYQPPNFGTTLTHQSKNNPTPPSTANFTSSNVVSHEGVNSSVPIKDMYSNNSLNPPRNDLNPQSNMQHNEPRNDFTSMPNNNFYGNTPSSNYEMPQHQLKGNPTQSSNNFPNSGGDVYTKPSNNFPDSGGDVYTKPSNNMHPNDGVVQNKPSAPTSGIPQHHQASSNHLISSSISSQQPMYSDEPPKYVCNNKFVNSHGNDFPNNKNIQQNEPSDDFSDMHDFYHNTPSSNYRTPQYQTSEQPISFSKEHSSNVGLQKDTNSSPPNSFYRGSSLEKCSYPREEFCVNRPKNSQHDEPRNDLRDMYDYSQLNYGNSHHQSKDHPTQPKGYYTSSYAKSQKITDPSPLKNFYGNSLEKFFNPSENDFHTNPTPEIIQRNEPSNDFGLVNDSYSYSPPSNYRTPQQQSNDKTSNNFVNLPGDNFRDNVPGKMQHNEPRIEYDGVRSNDLTSNYRTPQYRTINDPDLSTTKDSYVQPLNNSPNACDDNVHGTQSKMQYSEHRNNHGNIRYNDGNSLLSNYGIQQHDYSAYQKYFTHSSIESKKDMNNTGTVEHMYDKNYRLPPKDGLL